MRLKLISKGAHYKTNSYPLENYKRLYISGNGIKTTGIRLCL